MFSEFFLLLPILFMQPTLSMQWLDSNHQVVVIKVEGVDERWQQCVSSGFQARCRIEVKVCRRRKSWLDHCTDAVVLKRGIESDPVSGLVKATSDTVGDKEDPESVGYESYQEALPSLLAPFQVSLDKLAEKEPEILREKKVYLSAQVVSACRGEVNLMLRRLSQFLSFGLLDLQDRSSGWIDFEIK
ncbi:MAG: hypothetical protein GYA55_11335 [SAR324 cluster bacterium]|uniref:Uncharacterized protein n=1 Tax=SAR324 cluster bacterium TaxID=2024889 RepID=A0A7X9IKI8_9DELT|nr:hypothetical protein [SAR324 cluster bacterium]